MKALRVRAIVTLIMTLQVAAAASQESDSEPYELPDLTTVPYTGDLDGMLERRVIRVLTTYSKTMYFIDRGTQYGLVYETIRKFEDQLNKELGKGHPTVHVVFVPTTVEKMIPALLAGRGDIAAANLTITPERAAEVSFTDPTLTGVNEILVSGPGAAPVKRLEDLAGKPVYVRRSSSYHASLEALNKRFRETALDDIEIHAVPEDLPNEDILEMVNAGIFSYTVTDSHVANFWVEIFRGLVLHNDIPLRTNGSTAWMIRNDSPLLQAKLNEFLRGYPKGSLQRNVLLQKYLKSTKFVRNPNAEKDAARLREVAELFRKYGDRYELDFLLMAAQGYQESRLDQSARNPSGAVGIMQVLPTTGNELNVGDISELEPNIHAGTKYIRFMIDTYFKTEPMTELDKGLFAFAAYNAGPGRVRGLRREAERRGLDPNVWFDNVEIVAAEKIGHETVRYVSNIYKYYLAYKFVYEGQSARKKARASLMQDSTPEATKPE